MRLGYVQVRCRGAGLVDRSTCGRAWNSHSCCALSRVCLVVVWHCAVGYVASAWRTRSANPSRASATSATRPASRECVAICATARPSALARTSPRLLSLRSCVRVRVRVRLVDRVIAARRDGWLCDERRTCVCVPECTGKVCGASDGCGGACHPAGCGNSTCVPDCRNRTCGDDGCGGSCGQCPDSFVCLESGEVLLLVAWIQLAACCGSRRDTRLCRPVRLHSRL
jgi:hypothetical protein